MFERNKNAKVLTDLQRDVLIGGLLGDSCLGIRKKCVSPRITIRRQLRDMPYLQWQFDIFNNLCRPKAITTGEIYDERYNKIYKYCNLESRYIPAFKSFYEHWYPNKEKHVPTDLLLNPLIIAIWLCDDGNIKIVNKQRINITFHTQGFLKDEVYFLKSLLDDRYNVSFRVHPSKKDKGENDRERYIICGADHQSRPLLKEIDSIFPESMKRKSKIWRNENVHFYHDEPKQYSGYKANEIRQNVVVKLQDVIFFTMKSVCQDLGYFQMNEKSPYFRPHATVLNFIRDHVKSGNIIPLTPIKVLSMNTPLKLIKEIRV